MAMIRASDSKAPCSGLLWGGSIGEASFDRRGRTSGRQRRTFRGPNAGPNTSKIVVERVVFPTPSGPRMVICNPAGRNQLRSNRDPCPTIDSKERAIVRGRFLLPLSFLSRGRIALKEPEEHATTT